MQRKDISNYISCKWSTELCAINILKLVNDMQRETYPLLYSGKTSIWKSTYMVELHRHKHVYVYIVIDIFCIIKRKVYIPVVSIHLILTGIIHIFAYRHNKINTLFVRVINCNCIQLHTRNSRFHLCNVNRLFRNRN